MFRPRGHFVRWLVLISIAIGLVGVATLYRDRLSTLWRSGSTEAG